MRFLCKVVVLNFLFFSGMLIGNGGLCQAQNLRKAESYFSSFEYANAIPVYEKILQKKKDTMVMIHLAHAYRMTHEYEKAEKMYKELAQIFDKNPDYHFLYAKMLKIN